MKVIPVPIDRIEIVPDRDRRGEGVDLKDLLESIPTIGMLHQCAAAPPSGPRETLLGSLACGAGRRVARTRLIRPLPGA